MKENYKFIDLHCDTLMGYIFADPVLNLRQDPRFSIDLERLLEAGVAGQFFAIFVPHVDELIERFREKNGLYGAEQEGRKAKDKPLSRSDFLETPENRANLDGVVERLYVDKMLAHFYLAVEENSDILAFAGNSSDLKSNRAAGKISGLLTLEDGRTVEGSLERLEDYYKQGIRLISLTWNYPNCFGYPNSSNPEAMQQGLSSFGKEAIELMNDLGMIIDVSHLSDGGFNDVAKISKKPFIASHSNARALTNHPRNLTDEMIHTMAEAGGLAGINFSPSFLKEQVGENRSQFQSRIEDMVRHLNHMKNVGGEDFVALGSDFDGIGGDLEISSCDQLNLLVDALEKDGWTARQIEKFTYGNAYRVIEEVLG